MQCLREDKAACYTARFDGDAMNRKVVMALVQNAKREPCGRAGLRVRDAFIKELPGLLERI